MYSNMLEMLYSKFRYLEYIKFAQFELWPSDEVDFQAYYDRRMLPPDANSIHQVPFGQLGLHD
jgi:hypothetical protein